MKILNNIWQWFCLNVIPNIHWNWAKGIFRKGKYWDLTDEDWKKCEDVLAADYHVILLRRDTHFTTYLIAIANRVKCGEWGFWSHAFLNIEDQVDSRKDFRIIEATNAGVHYSPFEKVFDCDSVCFLRPRGFTAQDWNEAMAKAILDLGKSYDTAFNIDQDEKLSCVELIRSALKGAAENYDKDFHNLESAIQKSGYLTPQMLYDCPDFEIVLEIRR